MRALLGLAIALLVVACERAIPDECPDGARVVTIPPPKLDDSRWCELADGTRHGPSISGGFDTRYIRGEYEHGKKHGVWRTYLRTRLIGETHYQHGVKHGRNVHFHDGTAILDCDMHTGVFHGHCDVTREAGFYLAGYRVGTWTTFDAERRVTEVKRYGMGVLLSVDGRPFPPPPATIVAGTTTIDRQACDRDGRSTHTACREIFEAHQRCALAARPDECRRIALQEYLEQYRPSP
jgi:hypothetical protein